MSYFENKVVWITGASSGIGEALAYTFAKQKAKLILTARREAELERVKAACNLPDADVMLLPLDVSEYGKMDEAAAKVIARFGDIDILVNNAGLSHWSKVRDLSMDVVKIIMDVNFMGGVALTKAVLPGMLNKKKGHIVVVSSILGKITTQKQAAYVASKHALMGFYDTLRSEYYSSGLKVLLVCPGFVRTNVAKNSLNRQGEPINKDNSMIQNGLDPMYVAEKILQAIQSNKEEILLAGTKEKMAVLIKRLAPGLFSKYIGKSKLV